MTTAPSFRIIGLSLLLALAAWWGQADDAQSAPEETNSAAKRTQVTAVGLGTSSDEALKDAFRKAIWQVVGGLVEAETLVKNDEIISDKILTYSKGLVTSYKELENKQEAGIYKITIQANVERLGVITKLKEANIPYTDIDGKGLFSKILTTNEAEKNAKILIAKALQGFPMNVMEAEVIGNPEVVSRNDSSATLRFRIQIKANPLAYNTFVENLKSVLQIVAKEQGTAETKITPKKNPKYKDHEFFKNVPFFLLKLMEFQKKEKI